jgi:2-oxoacid:acceptor oxidoreductase delta subunit (pyruvate/2-ketoisovalerate family)
LLGAGVRRSLIGPVAGRVLVQTWRRCLSCGNCHGVCSDNAVIKLAPGKRFQFNFDYCKGCGMCVSECPCGAIKMVPEEN